VQGVVKVYDPNTGMGVVTLDEGGEVLLAPGSLKGSIFRTLRQGQRIVFDTRRDGDRVFVEKVRIGSDGY
jgi:CspA family cold shock protein